MTPNPVSKVIGTTLRPARPSLRRRRPDWVAGASP